MEARDMIFVFLLLSWMGLAHSTHQHFVTPDQKSGMLGSLSSPEFADAASPQRVAVVDNGYYNPQRTLTSLSALSNFNSVVDNVHNLPDQMPYDSYPGEQTPTQTPTDPYSIQQQPFQMTPDSYQQTSNQGLSNRNVNEPSGLYRHIPLNNVPEQLPNEKKNNVHSSQTEELNKAPIRTNSIADQIDITKQERAYTIDQPTIKKAVNRQKIAKANETTSAPLQNKGMSTNKPKILKPKAVIFKSGDTIYRPGQKSASYRFTGASFTRSPKTTIKPTPEPLVTKADLRTTKMEELKTTFKNSILGGYFTTESPVTMWKQSIENGLYETTKGFSVPITSNYNMLTPTSQPPNPHDKRYSFVNPTDGGVIGGHIVSGEKPPSDIIVNHHETSVSDRNKLFQAQRNRNTNWNYDQNRHQHHNTLSSSLSNMKVPQKPKERQAPVVKPTETSSSAHVVSNTETVADIIIGRSQQGSLSMNTEPILPRPVQHVVDNSHQSVQKHQHNVNTHIPESEPLREIVDFQNGGMGLGLGSLSNFQKAQSNNNHNKWMNDKQFVNELGFGHQRIPSQVAQSNQNLQRQAQTYSSKQVPAVNKHTGNNHLSNDFHGRDMLKGLQNTNAKTTSVQNNYHGQRQRHQRQRHHVVGNENILLNNQQTLSNLRHNKQNAARNQQQRRPTKNRNQHHQRRQNKPINHSQGGSLSTPGRASLSSVTQEKRNEAGLHNQQEIPSNPSKLMNHQIPPAVPNHQNGQHLTQRTHQGHSQSGSQPSTQSEPMNPGSAMQNSQHSSEPVLQQDRAFNSQQGNPSDFFKRHNQIQTQIPGAENVQYNIVNMPPSPAEYFHQTVEYIPEQTNVRSVKKLQSSNTLYQNNNLQKSGGPSRVEYNIRNDKVETNPYNTINKIPAGQRWKHKETHPKMQQGGNEHEPLGKIPQNMYQVDTSLYGTQDHQFTQSNNLNSMTPKLNPRDIMDTSFNMPKEIINNPHIQMLNIENPRQSDFSLTSTNILDIKPIDGLSSDIVQISELTNNIPIIEIPINYNYYETTTVPIVENKPNLHTTSSLAAQGYGIQQAFTRAPEMLQMATRSTCGYEVNPFNKNEYAMSKAEATAGRFTSKCPAGLHFRVDRCRCDWPQAQPISSSGSSLTSCHYVVNPTNKGQYANSIQDAQAGKLFDCPASLHFDEQKCRCDWPWP